MELSKKKGMEKARNNAQIGKSEGKEERKGKG